MFVSGIILAKMTWYWYDIDDLKFLRSFLFSMWLKLTDEICVLFYTHITVIWTFLQYGHFCNLEAITVTHFIIMTLFKNHQDGRYSKIKRWSQIRDNKHRSSMLYRLYKWVRLDKNFSETMFMAPWRSLNFGALDAIIYGP